jgi:hypothetical protein
MDMARSRTGICPNSNGWPICVWATIIQRFGQQKYNSSDELIVLYRYRTIDDRPRCLRRQYVLLIMPMHDDDDITEDEIIQAASNNDDGDNSGGGGWWVVVVVVPM